MGSLQFFVVMMTFYSYSVEAAKITCDVEALEWNEELLACFERNVFWSANTRSNYGSEQPAPTFDESDSGFRLLHILFYRNNGNPISYGYSMNKGINGADPMNVLFCKTEFIMDDEKAIFQYKPDYTCTALQWNEVKQEYDTFSQFYSGKTEEITFALVYVEKHAIFRIFQTCDGKGTWVQISDSVLNYYQKQAQGILETYSNIPVTLTELNQIIKDKLNNMEVAGQEFDILGRGIENPYQFSKEFDLLDRASKFVDEHLDV